MRSSYRCWTWEDYPPLGAEPRIWTVDTDWFLSRPQELYDLGHEPGELVNLAAAEPERVEAMRRRLEPWIGLGRVGRGRALHLDAATTLEQLRALGYVD